MVGYFSPNGADLELTMPVINTDHSLGYRQRNLRYEGPTLAYEALANTVRNWTNSRITVTNKRWRQLIREGLNATNGYSRVTYNLYNVPTRAYGYFYDPAQGVNGQPTTYYVDQWDFGPLPADPGGFSSSQADLLARQKFVSHYRERRTAFQGGVFLGELMETVRMIKNPAQALRRGLDLYHSDVKKRLKKSKHPNRTVRDTWLEYSYGWAPFVNDIHDIAKIACADPFRVRLPISGSGLVEWNEEQPDVNRAPASIGGPLFWVSKYRRSNDVGVRYKGAVYAENTPPSFPEQLGFSWSNLLPTIWELIPYSFLVDYFTNVGKVIEGVSTGPIWLAWGCKSTRKRSVSSYETYFRPELVTAGYNGSRKWNGYVTGHGRTGHYSWFLRESVEKVSVGLSDFTFKLPGSGTRWLNIAALARLRT